MEVAKEELTVWATMPAFVVTFEFADLLARVRVARDPETVDLDSCGLFTASERVVLGRMGSRLVARLPRNR